MSPHCILSVVLNSLSLTVAQAKIVVACLGVHSFSAGLIDKSVKIAWGLEQKGCYLYQITEVSF